MGDPVEVANAILLERGYRTGQLHVHVAALPGRVLLKGSRIVSPFADSPETVLRVVERCVPAAAELGNVKLTAGGLRARLDQSGSAGSST